MEPLERIADIFTHIDCETLLITSASIVFMMVVLFVGAHVFDREMESDCDACKDEE